MPFQKGNKFGCRSGRPKRPEIEQLRLAIEKVQKEHDRTLMEEFVHKAYEDTSVMAALMRKILPDKKIENLNVGGQEGNPIRVMMFGKDGADTK